MKTKKVEKVYITLRATYSTVKDVGIAIVLFMSLSPETINQRLKFGIIGKEEQASFDELREYLNMSCFKKGDKLGLFVVNKETGQKQNFWLDISKDWPEGLAENISTQKRESYEITSYLESIGILTRQKNFKMIKYKNFKFYLLNTWPLLEELEKKTKDEIVEFMKKMYQGGIFDEIEQLIRCDEFKNPKDGSYCYRIGHIVLMAICSAIDTLGAFLKGSKKTDSDVGERFMAFIHSYFPKKYSVEQKEIYKHLRCDSIHGWTLNKAYITGIENDQGHLSRRNGILHISLLEFFDDLKKAFLNYCEKIMSDDELKINILRRYKELKEK